MVLSSILSTRRKKKEDPEQPKLETQQKTIAPTAPEPKPAEQMTGGTGKRTITFLKGGNVEVTTAGGVSQILTKDEYKRYNEQLGGGSRDLTSSGFSDKVKKLVEIERENIAKIQAMQGKGGVGAGTAGMQPAPNTFGATAQDIFSGEIPEYKAAKGSFGGFISNENAAAMRDISRDISGKSPAQALITPLPINPKMIGLSMDIARQIGSNLKAMSGFSDRDPTDVRMVKDSLGDTSGKFKEEIKLLQQGYGDAEYMKYLIDNYKQRIAELESNVKRDGVENLAYWSNARKNKLQEEIDFYKRDLVSMEVNLMMAIDKYNQIQQSAQMQKEAMTLR
jgi:hypothetical protein